MLQTRVPLIHHPSPVAYLYAICSLTLVLYPSLSPLPSLVLIIDRIHPAVLDCPSSRTSDASSSYPPSPAQCAHLLDSVVSRDHKNLEKVHDGLSSSGFLAPGEHTLPVLNVSTDSDVNGSASLGFPSPVASFLNRDRIVRYVYYPSPSHSGNICMGSDDAI